MGKKQEIVTYGEGLYFLEMFQYKKGRYCVEDKKFNFRLIAAPDERDRGVVDALMAKCLTKAKRHFENEGFLPKKVRASALKGIDLIFLEVID